MKKSTILILSLALANAVFAESPIHYVEPRIGTDYSMAPTAGMFGKGSEERG